MEYTLDETPVYDRTIRTHAEIIFNPATGIFLGSEGKPENPEETHADIGRSHKLHADNISLLQTQLTAPATGSNQGPWSCEDLTLSTMPKLRFNSC